MSAIVRVKWSFEADFMQACSCDYGCPCEFSAPPTRGFCEGIAVWRITRGYYGEVKLDGLGFAFAARWPTAIHEGNGRMPFEFIAATFSKVLGPRYVPFRLDFNVRKTSVQVGDALRAMTEPIKNPVTGEPESIRIEHATGLIFQDAECVSTAEMKVAAGELNFSWPNKAAFVTRIKYNN